MIENKKWATIVEKIEFAYEPIVNIYSGATFGFEISIKNFADFGYSEEKELYDDAHKERLLVPVELYIRKNAVTTFMSKFDIKGIKLFYRFDRKLINQKIYPEGEYEELKKNLDIISDILILQIKQKIDKLDIDDYNRISQIFGAKGYKIAVDNYGYGCFNFRMLYDNKPDFLKIDKFFTDNIKYDNIKKIFVTSMTNSAKILGVDVIAKGVDSKETYYTCKELGIGLIQGKIVQSATEKIETLQSKYHYIEELHINDKRKQGDKFSIEEEMVHVQPVYVYEDMLDVLEKFRKNKETSFLPILDGNHYPLGIVKDKDLKDCFSLTSLLILA